MAEIIEIEPEVIDNVKEKTITKKKNVNYLLVYNDEVNSFEDVIMWLSMYCGKTIEESTDLSLQIHHEGKAIVLDGTFDELKPICETLLEKGLSAVIE